MRGLRGCLFLIFACMLCSKQGFFAHFFANMGVKMGVKTDRPSCLFVSFIPIKYPLSLKKRLVVNYRLKISFVNVALIAVISTVYMTCQYLVFAFALNLLPFVPAICSMRVYNKYRHFAYSKHIYQCIMAKTTYERNKNAILKNI